MQPFWIIVVLPVIGLCQPVLNPNEARTAPGWVEAGVGIAALSLIVSVTTVYYTVVKDRRGREEGVLVRWNQPENPPQLPDGLELNEGLASRIATELHNRIRQEDQGSVSSQVLNAITRDLGVISESVEEHQAAGGTSGASEGLSPSSTGSSGGVPLPNNN
ncbi:hypothetical protein F4809DRAFT_637517 [Biscogniauxia mediterranea]|nr:hypothetical protein F4809DRAFT_637517 [Biscogniauxia mediterranea]